MKNQNQYEVEKKFRLSLSEKERLLKDGKHLWSRSFTDTYYDMLNFKLTTKDTWLRRRGNNWELKIPLGDKYNKGSVDHYKEVTNIYEINEILDLKINRSSIGDFHHRLFRNDYFDFCRLHTVRETYKKEKFTIDIDRVTTGPNMTSWIFEIAEIELLVSEEAQMKKAKDEILAFAKKHGIKRGYRRGKVLQYLHDFKRDHYDALVRAGVARK